jgi:Transglutaminase-like superfamily
MQHLRRLLHLNSTEKRLLVRAFLWLGTMRLGLWLLPFGTLRAVHARSLQRRGRWTGEDAPSLKKVEWATAALGRHIAPLGNCLVQAMASQTLLSQFGHSTTLRIGICRANGTQLRAHAWLERDGRVVVGDVENLAYFTPLPPLEPVGRHNPL